VEVQGSYNSGVAWALGISSGDNRNSTHLPYKLNAKENSRFTEAMVSDALRAEQETSEVWVYIFSVCLQSLYLEEEGMTHFINVTLVHKEGFYL
jgi:hypothetical protein